MAAGFGGSSRVCVAEGSSGDVGSTLLHVELALTSFSSSSFSSSSCSAPWGRISRTQVSDAGLYTCVVSSQAGVADRSFTLQILGMEEPGI